jgi:uncharacterized repeat protein (TIGR02543 family)
LKSTISSRLVVGLLVALIPLGVVGSTQASGADKSFTSSYHTVQFFENSTPTDGIYAVQTSNVSASLTLFNSLNPAFNNPGHAFVGWNTNMDGSGISYADGAVYSFSSSLVLYAQWLNPYHTVQFFENSTPTDGLYAVQTSNVSTNLTLFNSLNPVFSHPGFKFVGWNTSPDGRGTAYADGVTYSFSSSMSLYAQWSSNATDTITFNSQGGSSVSSMSGLDGSTITLPNAPSYPGHTFNGWFAASTGGTSLTSPYTLSGSVTLYAQWSSNATDTISFDSQGGSSVSSMSGLDGSTITLPNAPSYPGHTFNGWFAAATGGTSLTSPYSLSGSVTLYAQWVAVPSVTVQFNLNGATGTLAPLTGAPSTSVVLSVPTNAVFPGHIFTSWNTDPLGKGSAYLGSQQLVLTTSMTLYAQWASVQTSTLWGSIGPFGGLSTSLSANLKRQVTQLANVIKRSSVSFVSLYGYGSLHKSVRVNRVVSARRASAVAVFLRSALRRLHVAGVVVSASGESLVSGATAARVEVFLR